MDKLYLHEIADAVDGKVIFGNPEVYCDSVITDSRIATNNSLFVRFGEDKIQAVDYLLSAFEKGASIALVTKIDEDIIPSERKGLIQVKDAEKALMSLAKYYRKRMKSKIIAISGSTGKTSTKDMLYGMLSKKFKVYKTEGNKNNNIGLPLMVLNSDLQADVCIFEMGMDTFGEIDGLSDIVRQDMAILTNIGMSHIENLKTQDNIFKAKMEITNYFDENNVLFLNADDPYFTNLKSDSYEIVKAGIENGDYKAVDIELNKENVSFRVSYKELISDRITIESPGLYNVKNAILCFAVSHRLGLKATDIKYLNFEKTKMRKERIEYKNITVINDAYNAAPESMHSAIDLLNMEDGRKIAILGDMLELGDFAKKAHFEVGEYAKEKVDILIAVGNFIDDYKKGFGIENFFGFNDFTEAKRELKNIIKKDDVVLLKASRGMAFERFLEELEII